MGRLAELSVRLDESGKAYGMRQLLGVCIFDYAKVHRPPWCSVGVNLSGPTLVVHARLWWPWWLLFGAGHVGTWLWIRRVTLGAIARLQVPVAKVELRVSTRRERPKR